ncbi:hypothetical protein M3O96_00790 [Aquiflexum sp. TKW24L]|uniref:DUF2683 family protein n=1 Tax=Aquiflexum sp. TKW24L TaxID=2942212 RepID=UPI0020BEA93D|nr:DUF2683 family protein [Aquiflexum sp. TKW24L]MCL6257604.1 hypothetical protein [Aquiflexum sp. TKW24L]
MELVLKKVKAQHLPLIQELAKILEVEIEEKAEMEYDSDFVKEVLDAKEDINSGKGVKVDIENLWK